MFFKNEWHKESFDKVLAIKPEIKKREQVIVYLLTSVPRVADNLSDFYVIIPKGDYEGYIELGGIEKYGLSSGEAIIVALAFNIFNGISIGVDITPYSFMHKVDKDTFKVYMSAIEMLSQ